MAAKSPEWGSIKEVVNMPLIDVPGDASWCSVVFMWLCIIPNLMQGIPGGLCQCCYRCLSVGACCIPCSQQCCSAMGSVLRGRPCWMAWTWWRYVIAGLIALLKNGRSRLALFMWEHAAFGGGRYWWHGEGIWCWSYADCESILKSEQQRKPAFGCVRACIPDLFPTNLLIFLSNTGPDSEWGAIRQAVHRQFLDVGNENYRKRVQELPDQIAKDWPTPKLADMNNFALLQKTVAKCVLYVMFEIWLTEAEAEMMTGWRTMAGQWVLPRLVHRFLFNLGIGKVKKLREDTVRLIEKYQLQSVFTQLNDGLDVRWRRSPVVNLCDELMFGVGFAGIGGTCAALESVGSFLQVKIPPESAGKKQIKWGAYDSNEKMLTKYKENPGRYIRETCRLDPPVTSATASFKDKTTVSMNGRDYDIPAGLLNQYTLSMANRDPTVFKDPEIFDPDRTNLMKALTWNGAFGADDEKEYPRICPGRYLSLDVVTAVTNHAIGHKSKIGDPASLRDAASGTP